MKRTLKDYIFITFKGVAMGAADVVPGVSGGTIAFISGIYEELIESINNLSIKHLISLKNKGIKQTWVDINGSFLFALFFGIGISIISLAKGIKWLLENKPILLWSYFFGLVIASILLIGKQISKYDIKSITAIVLASILSYLITISEPFSSPENHLYLLFSGAIGIIAMILPGVSGAFILLLLGAYHTIIGSISDITTGIKESNLELVKTSFINLFVFGIGALLGLKLFSKVLNWLFKNYKNLTLSILVGFMVGSLNKIWPWKKVMQYRINSKGEEVPFIEKSISPFNEHIIDPKFTYALLLLLIGFLTIYLLEKFSQSKKH